MKVIKHKFLNHKINPQTDKNNAEFFYGRSKNYLWKLLPLAFRMSDLKKSSIFEKLLFIKKMKIDLIEEVKVEDGQEANYADDFIDSRVLRWRNVITEIENLEKLKKVFLQEKRIIKSLI